MSEEIKEILDRMQELVEHKYDKEIHTYNLFDDIQDLLNYITNLQKKYENAVADYELEKYKNIKALSWTNRIIEIIKQQPSEDDTWILDNLQSIKCLLQGVIKSE